MSTKSAELVKHAEQKCTTRLTKSLESFAALREGYITDARDRLEEYGLWAKALSEANSHIAVDKEEIAAATDAYNEVADYLATNLSWPLESISIKPQGSVSTKTLIRSPNGSEKFDIDAVCKIDVSHIEADNPVSFFESIGQALKELEAQPKRRCWKIPFTGQRFYLEFTPSIPLNTISEQTLHSMAPRYSVSRYGETALAVVDMPTESWKTSNSEGMSKWVNYTSERRLIRSIAMEAHAYDRAAASVSPVPDQTVDITDTLRVAIRLFKRHRDMCARRGIIDAATKPISVIIVTLLTSCYEGLADLNRSFEHPVELLDELSTLMPHLVLELGGKYRVDNPTVEGENFAEKWNDDGGDRYKSFMAWTSALSADLQTILAEKDPQAISKRVREVFGIPAPTGGGNNLTTIQPSAPRKTPAGRGLA